jgi:SHS2 domain-containing protein
MYEYLEHTADVGIRLAAPDLDSLLADAGRALFGLIVENLEEVRPDQAVHIEVPGKLSPDALDYLLFDWLSELIHQFEATRLILCELDVRASGEGISAEGRGEELDPDRHRLGHEVKAVTYHQLYLRQTANGWEGQAIVDL